MSKAQMAGLIEFKHMIFFLSSSSCASSSDRMRPSVVAIVVDRFFAFRRFYLHRRNERGVRS